MASRVLGVFKFCGPLWWCRSNLFLFDLPVVCLFGDPKLAWDALQGASHVIFFKKKVGRVEDGSSFCNSAREFVLLLFYFFLLFLPFSVNFFVFLYSPPLGPLSAFQSLFWFWTHVASAISLNYLLQGGPLSQWTAYFHPELSLLPKSPALFRGFKIVIE